MTYHLNNGYKPMAPLHAAVFLLAALLAGCGTSGGLGVDQNGAIIGSGVGVVQVTILLPPPPTAALAGVQSIKVTLLDGALPVASQIVGAPAGRNTVTIIFSSMAAGHYSLQAAAFPLAGGAGSPVDSGTTSVDVFSNQTTTITLALQSGARTQVHCGLL